jgi:hypothetical protein
LTNCTNTLNSFISFTVIFIPKSSFYFFRFLKDAPKS